jgi:arylsulfatase A-like enzyme
VAPGITRSGTTSAVPVNGIDWYPTLLELTGVSVPSEQDVDGVSMVSLLKGGEIADRPLFWHYPHYGNQGGEPSSIVLQGDWKLIYYHEDNRNEIYNLSQDPVEQVNLADKEKERVKSMRRTLDKWLKDTDAKLPVKDPQFDSAKRLARWESLKTRGIMSLERQHANFVKSSYTPNKDWWGSAPQD